MPITLFSIERNVSIVYEIPPLFISKSEISKFGLPSIARFNIASLSPTSDIFFLWGGLFAGMNITLSKASASHTVCAIKRCPMCGGSNVPPKIQILHCYSLDNLEFICSIAS